MSKRNLTHQLMDTVKALSDQEALQGLCHQHRDETPLPSSKALEEIIDLSRSVLFPGYFGNSSINMSTIQYHIGVRLELLQENSLNKSWQDFAFGGLQRRKGHRHFQGQ